MQATGRGAHVIAGVAGYCVGNLHVPGYDMPWEDSVCVVLTLSAFIPFVLTLWHCLFGLTVVLDRASSIHPTLQVLSTSRYAATLLLIYVDLCMPSDFLRLSFFSRRAQVEASNGASDYGNKFGEPVITGNAPFLYKHSCQSSDTYAPFSLCHRLHALVWAPACRRRAPRVGQAHHVQRRHWVPGRREHHQTGCLHACNAIMHQTHCLCV